MKSLQAALSKRITPYVIGASASLILITVFYIVIRYSFTPLFISLQTGKYLYFVNTNIFTVREYAVKVSFFIAVTLVLLLAAKLSEKKLTSKIVNLDIPPLAYLEHWRENKRVSAGLLFLAYLFLAVNAAAVAIIWFNVLQEHLPTLYSLLFFTTTASMAFSTTLLLLPYLDETTKLTNMCKKLLEEIPETPTKEDYKKIEILTVILHAMVTDTILRNTKQIEEINPQPYLATITLTMIHGEKNNVQKARQIVTKLLDHLAGGEYHLLLQTLTEAEKQLPDIPKIAEKMELTLNEPAQFIYAPRTRKNVVTRTLLSVAATSAMLVTISLLKWLFYFTTS
ncbi:MAG: hypothetical protein QW526_08160 [Candidatus Jordarchaeales archaeon]